MQLASNDEADEVRRPASFPGAASTKKLTTSRSLPELLRADGDTLSLASTENVNWPIPGNTGRSSGKPRMDIDYDYLGKVKLLCDKIEADVYDLAFERHFQKGHGMVYCINDHDAHTVLYYDLDWKQLNARLLTLYFHDAGEEAQRPIQVRSSLLKRILDRGSQEDPVVLIVEGIDREGVQMLGTDLNIDPRFFAEHLGPLNPHDFYDGKVPDLSSVSLGFGKQQHQDVIRPGGKLIGIHHSSTLPSKLPECWPRAGTDRVQNFGPTGSLMPRISFCQVSQHDWIILADHYFSIESLDSPFREKHMLHIDAYFLPPLLEAGMNWRFALADMLLAALANDQSELATRQLLFGSSTDPDLEQMADVMPCAIALATWQHNVRHFEKRLEETRHQAIAEPSLDSFLPLTLLRRNIADLQYALMAAKSCSQRADQYLTETRRRIQGSRPQPYSARYDALLGQVKVMSTTLNNEIQLVICSVTVQDSAIMKRQSQRATLLTILAVIYLPLSLVTSIFGMNIKEIDDRAPPFWTSVVALLVVAGVTAAGYFGYRH